MKEFFDAELDHIRANRLGEFGVRIGGVVSPEQERLLQLEILQFKEANGVMLRSDWFLKMKLAAETK